VSSLLYLGQSILSTLNIGKKTREILIADGHAAELLEFFLSQDTNRMIEYLSRNPVSPSSSPYPLCASIGSNTTYPDPLTKLEQTSLRNAKRFYRVEVVDMASSTITSKRSLCGSSPKDLARTKPNALTPTQTLLVTVGVSWKDAKGENLSTSLSSVVPIGDSALVVPLVVSSSPLCVSGASVVFAGSWEIRWFINGYYGYDVFPEGANKGFAWADNNTRKKVCELTDHPIVQSHTTGSNSSCWDNSTVQWVPSSNSWKVVPACTHNVKVSTLTCGCP
jgi:hypothetical protein